MPIEVYMDESNVHEDTDFLTVSAAWAEKLVWNLWEEEWLTAIQPLNLFHSCDVWNRSNDCADFTRQFRDELSNRAMSAILKFAINGRIGEIDRRSFEKKFGNAAITKNLVEHPYYLPLIWTFNRMFEILGKAGAGNVSFFHERNDYESGALEYFSIAKKRFDRPNYSLVFVEKTKAVPLQCADAFAFFGMQRLRNPQHRSKALEVADGGSQRIQALAISEQQLIELATRLKNRKSKL